MINVVLKLRLFLFLSNKNIRIKIYWLFAEEVFCIFNFFRLNQGSTYKIVINTNVFYVFHHYLKSSLYFGVFEHFLNRRKKKTWFGRLASFTKRVWNEVMKCLKYCLKKSFVTRWNAVVFVLYNSPYHFYSKLNYVCSKMLWILSKNSYFVLTFEANNSLIVTKSNLEQFSSPVSWSVFAFVL